MRWPLHPLLHLRDHRVTAAERALLQALREVQQARLAETAAADAVETEQQRYAHQQAQPLTTPNARGLQQRQMRLEAHRQQIAIARARLDEQRQRVWQAEQQEAAVREAYNAARRKAESLKLQQQAWQRQQSLAQQLDEEAELEDRVLTDHFQGQQA
ncbi:MAG: hypothetical protein QG638_2387 [Pseudomonadota bacterium]|nr:hypothetical protein [Pseudomonadota bacterium]